MATGLVLKPVSSRLSLSRSSSYGDIPADSPNVSLSLNLFGYPSMELLCASSSDLITCVKMRLQATQGFYTRQHRQLLTGRDLNREQQPMPSDFRPMPEQALNLIMRMSDLVFITIKTTSGKEYHLSLDRSQECRVKDIKRQITEKDGLPMNDQIICFRGSELDDHFSLKNLKKEACTLHLIVKIASKIHARPVDGGKRFDITVDVGVPGKPLLSNTTEKSKKTIIEPDASEVKRGNLNKATPRKTASPKHSVINATPLFFSNSNIDSLISSVSDGLRSNQSPKLTTEGSGGCYFMFDLSGKNKVAVFKPIDEEPLAVNCPRDLSSFLIGEGLKKGTEVGGGAIREVAAYFLDYPSDSQGFRIPGMKTKQGYAGVPTTVMVKCSHEGFHYSSHLYPNPFNSEGKTGSLQQFVSSLSNCEDMGPSAFPADEVHKIALLDIRLVNTDRNGANILVNVLSGEDAMSPKRFQLTPIDHGYCFPNTLEDCTFEWLYWPQASIPFSSSALRYISSLDSSEDLKLLKNLGFNLNKKRSRILQASTMLLKKGAMAGLTAFDIGSLMVREKFDEESVMERMLRLVTEEDDDNDSDDDVVFLQNMSLALDSQIVLVLASKNLSLTMNKSASFK